MPGGLFIAWGQCPLESFPVYYVRTVVFFLLFPSFLFLFLILWGVWGRVRAVNYVLSVKLCSIILVLLFS